MERKKLLLVAISVGVVLLIIIGIPLMIIAPRQISSPAYIAQTNVPTQNWNRPDPVFSAPADIQEMWQTPQTIAEPQAFTNNIQPNEHAFAPPAETRQVTTITVRPPETAAVPTTTARQAQNVPAARPAPARTAPTQQVTQTQAAPAARPAPAAPRETTRPAAARAEPSRTINNYWIQTGAFSTHVSAEGVRKSLADKGIASIIDNREINGRIWYRVRVGPYTSETEASYWLALVKSIDGFGDSQIRQTQAVR
jgi:DedD protein